MASALIFSPASTSGRTLRFIHSGPSAAIGGAADRVAVQAGVHAAAAVARHLLGLDDAEERIGRHAAIFLGEAELQQAGGRGLAVELAREFLGLVPLVDIGHDLAVDEAADGARGRPRAPRCRTGSPATAIGQMRLGESTTAIGASSIRLLHFIGSSHSALTALNSRSYLQATRRQQTARRQGTETGYFSSTHPQWARGRLHLRPGRARLRADLQGDRAGQLRPGRPADAGRLRRPTWRWSGGASTTGSPSLIAVVVDRRRSARCSTRSCCAA